MTECICEICMDKPECKNFKCLTCKNTVCIECFKLISRDFFDEENCIMVLNYICPICRTNENYTYYDFDKDDIVNMVNSHLKYIKDEYKNNIDKLINNRIKETEEYKKKNETLKKNLRFLCERDKNKTVGKFLIQPLYTIDW